MQFFPNLISLILTWNFVKALYHNCDFYQELKPNKTYYVYSPGYPDNYKRGISCRWYAVAPPTWKVHLQCFDFLVGKGKPCAGDWMAVSPSGAVDFHDAKLFCGKHQNIDITSHKNIMNIALITSHLSDKGRLYCTITAKLSKSGPSECFCGWTGHTSRTRSNRIVGGSETGINEFPMMVGLVDLNRATIICGATIIASQYILTAAHCVYHKKRDELLAIVGEHNFTTGEETSSTRTLEIKKIIVHPLYDSATLDNDIALLQVSSKISYNLHVGPACLPFKGKTLKAKDSVVALGWGTNEFSGKPSDTLQKVTLRVIDPTVCKMTFKQITKNHLCTFDKSKDTCQIDSGGPILSIDPATKLAKLEAMVSYGINCASGFPSVNTKVSSYLDWIVAETGRKII